MKYTIAFVCVTLFVAVIYGAPDWVAVEAKANQIKTAFEGYLQQIRNISMQDNAEVGASMGKTLDTKGAEARAVFDNVINSIVNRSLTEEKCIEYFGTVTQILMAAHEEIQGDLEKLCDSGKTQIGSVFLNVLLEGGNMVNDMYSLIRSSS